MLTHDNVVVSGQNANMFDHFTPDDTLIAYLPMAWVGDHIFSYGQALPARCASRCPESPETAIEDRREIGPTYFFAPPRVFENMLTQIMVRMEDAGRFKKAMFDYFLGGREPRRREAAQRPAGAAQGPAALCARRHAGLRAAAQSHGLLQPARRLHRRRGDRAASCSRSTARSAST